MRLLSKPDGPAAAQHVEQVLLDARADLVRDGLHQALVVPRPVAGEAEIVGAHRVEEADGELGGEVAGHAEQTAVGERRRQRDVQKAGEALQDRKSTRLNSSHANISYAAFCLKKKKQNC